MAANPQTALPRVNSVGMMAIFFTVAATPQLRVQGCVGECFPSSDYRQIGGITRVSGEIFATKTRATTAGKCNGGKTLGNADHDAIAKPACLTYHRPHGPASLLKMQGLRSHANPRMP